MPFNQIIYVKMSLILVVRNVIFSSVHLLEFIIFYPFKLKFSRNQICQLHLSTYSLFPENQQVKKHLVTPIKGKASFTCYWGESTQQEVASHNQPRKKSWRWCQRDKKALQLPASEEQEIQCAVLRRKVYNFTRTVNRRISKESKCRKQEQSEQLTVKQVQQEMLCNFLETDEICKLPARLGGQRS